MTATNTVEDKVRATLDATVEAGEDPALLLDARPADIPDDDWQQIVLGATFAKVYAIVVGHELGEHVDADLDFVGELQGGLEAQGYVIVRADRLAGLTSRNGRLADVLGKFHAHLSDLPGGECNPDQCTALPLLAEVSA